MKKLEKQQRLVLGKEKIRELVATRLEHVAGGMSRSNAIICSTHPTDGC